MTSFNVLTLAFLTSGGILSLGFFLWFLLRKQSHRVWLPTLRVIELESTRLRKLTLQHPPWVPFLLFLFVALGFWFFTSQPKTLKKQATSPASVHVHFFLDLNPSIAGLVTIPQYIQRVESVWNELAATSKISVSTSHDGSVIFPTEFAQIQERIYSLGFHRGGIDLASALRQQREKIGELEGLLIFSDASQAAWRNLNWKFLTDEMRVYWVDVGQAPTMDNIFFHDIRLASAPYDPTLEYDIDIERRGHELPQRRGNLKAKLGAQTLASVPWQMGFAEQHVVVRASLPANQLVQVNTREDAAPLLWELELFEPDAIALDNTFRTPLKGLRQDALLVGEPSGERQLEDTFYQLRTALETFGFVPQRIDRWNANLGAKFFPFIVLAIDENIDLQETCPLSLRNPASYSRLREGPVSKGPLVWLMPTQAGSSLQRLCTCFHKLILQSPDASNAAACANVHNRDSLGELMSAWGVGRLGGKISSSQGSLGWFKEDKETGLSIAAFSIPLKPSRQLNLDHAMFPLMIKELLLWHGLLEASSFQKKAFADWPRVTDISQLATWQDGALSAEIKDSNVPLGASTLLTLSKEEMPPQWVPSVHTMAGADYRFQKEDYDPTFWIYSCLGAVIVFMLLESLWNFRRRSRGPRTLLNVLLVFFFLIGKTPSLHAEVVLPVLGKPYDAALDAVVKQVSLRTSVELADGIRYLDTSAQGLSEPWYWVRDKDLIRNSDGSLKSEFRYWLKRGGFLVVQGMDTAELKALTGQMFGEEGPESSWQAIPPDHEVLRSFYLIDALPSCRGQVWYGFRYDSRLAILAVPFDFLQALADPSELIANCEQTVNAERKLRLYINITMVALTTDYKKDQIHTREILKRLR